MREGKREGEYEGEEEGREEPCRVDNKLSTYVSAGVGNEGGTV